TKRRTAPCGRWLSPTASDDLSRVPDADSVNVPLLDLVAQYRAIKDEVLPAIQEVIESQQFVMGPAVPRLEAAVAQLAGATHGIGARRSIEGQWRRAGELGWASGFSFFPSKNLGAWGDGGMIVTSDDALAERLRKLRLHGGAKQYHHDEVGTNSRLDSLQAA